MNAHSLRLQKNYLNVGNKPPLICSGPASERTEARIPANRVAASGRPGRLPLVRAWRQGVPSAYRRIRTFPVGIFHRKPTPTLENPIPTRSAPRSGRPLRRRWRQNNNPWTRRNLRWVLVGSLPDPSLCDSRVARVAQSPSAIRALVGRCDTPASPRRRRDSRTHDRLLEFRRCHRMGRTDVTRPLAEKGKQRKRGTNPTLTGHQAWARWNPRRQAFLNQALRRTMWVISGGAPRRTGAPTVPMPRFT